MTVMRTVLIDHAKVFCAALRVGTMDVDEVLADLEQVMREGGLSWLDIGASADEVPEWKKRGKLENARQLLGYLRRLGAPLETEDVMRDELAVGGWTLADLGTDESELAELAKKNQEFFESHKGLPGLLDQVTADLDSALDSFRDGGRNEKEEGR